MNNFSQLTLDFFLDDRCTFTNFYAGSNQELVTYLQKFSKQKDEGALENFIYLWGASGTGRSHLLQACCQNAIGHGLTAIYLPLQITSNVPLQIFDDLTNVDLICIDDIQNVSDQFPLEIAIFKAFNDLQIQNKKLIVAATTTQKFLPLTLSDLRSRLTWGITFHLLPLTDEEKIRALQIRANQKGIELSDEVGKFLLTHYNRETSKLFDTLTLLDKASLVKQRKLTIRFCKEILTV